MVKLNPEALSDIGCNIASGIIVSSFLENKVSNVKYYINALTLYRNFINCLDGKTNDKIALLKSATSLSEIYQLFIEDTKIFIDGILEHKIELVIYIPDYSKLKSKWSNFVDKERLGALKYYIKLTEDDALKILEKEFSNIIKHTDHKLPYYRDLYITTHIGHDLLSYTKYSSVILVESHTGEFKKKNKWYTKYHKLGDHDLSILPFSSILYNVFGDNTYVKPQNIKIRKYIYGLARAMKWYSGMIEASMLNSIKSRDNTLYTDLLKIPKLF